MSGAETRPSGSGRAVVGVEGAVEAAQKIALDVILCEHELLTGFPITVWENDARLSSTAVIGVSLSRRPNEAVTHDLNGVAGFLYLPTLDVENALRLIHAAAASTRRAQYNASPPKAYRHLRQHIKLGA